MDMERARFNMVEQQVRPWEVLDQRVLDLLGSVPREAFVPAAYRALAFADLELPIGHDQVMLPPRTQARALQSLDIRAADRVLEVGTGSGYLTALLARLAHHVYSVEIIPELAGLASRNLAAAGVANVTVETGDAAAGWPSHAPYDAILVGGAMAAVPDSLREQLRPGGRMFVVVGVEPVMEARLITRAGENQWTDEVLFETLIPPLANAPEPSRFVF
ncbi:MAG: protein-L-isoaspartate O-methyltransferase [Gammaproteobacteria bacterium]|nr:protein-L-isoaspartate O-methyltransferase [Gammaproteobacteria bacterium]